MSQAPVDTPRHSRKGLYIPFIIVGIGLLLWTGWWFYLTHEVKTRLTDRLDRLEASGWTVKYDRLSASGWPAHARITLVAPEIIAPSAQGIRTPRIIMEASSYRPDKWMIGTPDTVTLIRGDRGETKLEAKAIRMSVSGLRQRWPNVAAELVEPRFTPAETAQPFALSGAKLIQLYMRPHVGAGQVNSPDVDVLFRLVEAQGREGGPLQAFAQSGHVTLQVEAVVQNASALRQSANARGLLAGWSAAGGRFVDVRGEMKAGVSHALLTSPELRIADSGHVEGSVNFKAKKPLAAIAGLAGSNVGIISDSAQNQSTASEAESDDAQNVDLNIKFENGRTHLGPFPLAPAPRLF